MSRFDPNFINYKEGSVTTCFRIQKKEKNITSKLNQLLFFFLLVCKYKKNKQNKQKNIILIAQVKDL